MATSVQELYPIVLTLGLVVLVVGVLAVVFEKFGDTTQTVTTASEEGVTMTAGSGTTSFDEVTGCLRLVDGNNTARNWTCGGTVNITLSGTIAATSNATGGANQYNVSYTYRADNNASNTLKDGTNALTAVNSDWMPLLVLMVVLGIIIGLLVRSFTNRV